MTACRRITIPWHVLLFAVEVIVNTRSVQLSDIQHEYELIDSRSSHLYLFRCPPNPPKPIIAAISSTSSSACACCTACTAAAAPFDFLLCGSLGSSGTMPFIAFILASSRFLFFDSFFSLLTLSSCSLIALRRASKSKFFEVTFSEVEERRKAMCARTCSSVDRET